MNFVQKTKLAIAANKLVNSIGEIGLPQGSYATWIGAVVLVLSNWIVSHGSSLPAEWHAYLPPALAVLTGIHTLSALAWPPRGSAWTVSAVWVVTTQALGVIGQTANSLLPVAPPEWRDNVTLGIQFLMSLQTISSLHKNHE